MSDVCSVVVMTTYHLFVLVVLLSTFRLTLQQGAVRAGIVVEELVVTESIDYAASLAFFESRSAQSAVSVAMDSVPQDAAAASAAIPESGISTVGVDTSSTVANLGKTLNKVIVLLKDGKPGPGVLQTTHEGIIDYVGTGGGRQYDLSLIHI